MVTGKPYIVLLDLCTAPGISAIPKAYQLTLTINMMSSLLKTMASVKYSIVYGY